MPPERNGTSRRASMLIGNQPRRYGSKSMAKSKSLVLVLEPWDKRSGLRLVCVGNRSHYHAESGICCHVEAVSETLKPWHRVRVRYLPFGDKDLAEARAA